MSRIVAVVMELKAFVARLQARPDLKVSVAKIGGPAGPELLGPGLSDELRELFALMDGIHVEWQFKEPPGGGCIRIPPLLDQSGFSGETHLDLGDDFEAFLLDEIQPEGATWVIRLKKSRECRLLFGRLSDAIEPAVSVAEYLERAMASGFVYWWPACFRKNEWVSYDQNESTIRRFRGPAVTPRVIVPGSRVHIESFDFSKGCRGFVRKLHELPDATLVAEVDLDLGSRIRLPLDCLKPQDRDDAYERLRKKLPGPAVPLLEVLEMLARAIGPFTATFFDVPSNGRPSAGLFAAHGLQASIEFLLKLYDAAIEARIPFGDALPLARTGDELSPHETARVGWTHRVRDTFKGVLAGLVLLAHQRSSNERIAASGLIDAELRARLRRCSMAKDLYTTLSKDEVLSWQPDQTDLATRRSPKSPTRLPS